MQTAQTSGSSATCGRGGPYVLDGSENRFRIDGPGLDLPPRYVLALGMTLHELTTNAAKYGALSDEAGRVDIAWRVATMEGGARRLVMEWRESGGPAVTVPHRRGFGTRLINGGISHELGGTVHLDFDAAGLSCVMDVPLDEQDRFTSFRKGSGQTLSAA